MRGRSTTTQIPSVEVSTRRDTNPDVQEEGEGADSIA